MEDEFYGLPGEPVYHEKIRRIQNNDPVNAEEVLNPVIQALLDNAHFARLLAEALAAQNAADHTAIRQETAEAIAAIPTPDVSGQIGTHDSDAAAHSDIRGALENHQDDKSNPHGTTAAQVGARPDTWTPTAADVGASPTGHKHTKSEITDFPTSMPASDVPAWAKASSKPSYTAGEVGARPSTWTPSAADVRAVPTARKVNGKALTADIDLSAADVGALGLTVEDLKDIFLSGGVPYGKELTESWTALRTRIKAGNFKGIHIGDYKTITLTGGETVIMEVGGIDQYYRCGDQEIGHHVDFISRDCLAGTKVFNDTDKNNGTAAEPNPWRASKLFQTLNDANTGVYAKLPADLKACIIEKRVLLESRYSAAGVLSSSISWAWNNMGKLWLPTEVEVFGNTFWSDGDAGWTGGGGCNLQYPIFQGGAKHIIKGAGNGGGRCTWWEATARRQSSTSVCVVSYGGNARDIVATYPDIYAPLCFRIG